MDGFKNATVGALCLVLSIVIVWGLVNPAQIGEWLAKAEQARQNSMDAYWCQVYSCEDEFNEFGEMIND